MRPCRYPEDAAAAADLPPLETASRIMIDHADTGHSSVIPPHSSATTADWRRRPVLIDSAPSRRRPSANHVNIKPASAEVISSLISTLSTISPPLYQHSDYLPETFCHSTLSPPLPANTDFLFTGSTGDVEERNPESSRNRLGMDSELGEASRRRKEKACTPLIQAAADARPRSNLQKRISPTKIPRSDLRRSSGNGENGWKDTPSIGHLSIEPAPRLSVISTVSSESAGRKSIRSFKSLNFRDSKEGIFGETKSFGNVGTVVLTPNEDGSKTVEVNTDNFSMAIAPSSVLPEPTTAKVLLASAHANAYHLSTPCSEKVHEESLGLSVSSSSAVASPHMVPTRDSSLRRSLRDGPSYRNRKSYRSDSSAYHEDAQLQAEPSQSSGISSVLQKIEATEDDVSRRIKELQDRKRERDFSGAVTNIDSVGTPDASEQSQTPSPHADPHVPPNGTARDLQSFQFSKTGENVKKEATEPSAPSPAIVQRINRNSSSRVSSIGSSITPSKSFSPGKLNNEPQRESAPPPKRSNSRMLKRLSRPPSPLNSERHKRTSSNAVADERPTSTSSVEKAVAAYISSSRLSQKVFHPQTGRTISFSEVGDPNGSAVLCCVGMGLTRYITALYDELASTLKLRLITPDRPGVGASESHPDGSETPLGWPDDVLIICQHLKLTKFSILAHSAGAIYALATALRMPQHIRGRIHLLAPWIPPSQMAAFGTQKEALPVSALPYSQRFLRSLPTPFLRAANSSFLSTTSTSISTRLSKTPRHSKRKSVGLETAGRFNERSRISSSAADYGCTEASISKEAVLLDGSRKSKPGTDPSTSGMVKRESELIYDRMLTEAIWNAATMGANPAVDLLVCLERPQSIGFRYVDITRSVVIHHGSKDSRVPVENVKWLGKTMKKCEVRILDGEGHGLMASAAVIGGVLMEMATEWEEWMRLVQGKSSSARRIVRA